MRARSSILLFLLLVPILAVTPLAAQVTTTVIYGPDSVEQLRRVQLHIGDAALSPNRARSATVAEWFNTDAFVPNAVGKDGTVGRNILDAPGFRDVDLGIFRDFTIGERFKFQFRAESTNAFNMVSLNPPSLTLSSSSFGSISSASTMRQIQLGLRLHF